MTWRIGKALPPLSAPCLPTSTQPISPSGALSEPGALPPALPTTTSWGRSFPSKSAVCVLRDNHSGNIIAPAPIFDNGLSLFCYAGKEDYANLDEYAKTRSNPYNISYEEVCAEVMGPKQKEQLRRMIGFRFKRHESLGLPEEHLQAIEKHLESRVRKLLAIPTRHLKQEKAR